MKIVCTGAAGFIGSNFVHYMAGKHPDYDFVLVDKLTYAAGEAGYSWENLEKFRGDKRFRFVEADICDEEAMFDALYMGNAVINFAAESHVGRAIVKSARHIRSNILGAANIAEVATNYHMRMIHISTDEVYGEIKTKSFDENSPLRPQNRYASAKAAAEALLYGYKFPPHNLDILYTRSANNFGKYQSQEKFTHVIAESIAKGRPIPVHGRGTEVRDWLYVMDNCSAIDAVLHKGKQGEFYNISAHNEKSNADLAKLAIKHFGGSIKFVPNRPGNDARYSISTKKIEKLGWKPEAAGKDFEKYMLETMDYYIKGYKHASNKNNSSFGPFSVEFPGIDGPLTLLDFGYVDSNGGFRRGNGK